MSKEKLRGVCVDCGRGCSPGSCKAKDEDSEKDIKKSKMLSGYSGTWFYSKEK